jgi:hypothetical protein
MSEEKRSGIPFFQPYLKLMDEPRSRGSHVTYRSQVSSRVKTTLGIEVVRRIRGQKILSGLYRSCTSIRLIHLLSAPGLTFYKHTNSQSQDKSLWDPSYRSPIMKINACRSVVFVGFAVAGNAGRPESFPCQ